MNCKQIQALMDLQSFKDWKSSGDERVKHHIENCPDCRAAFSAAKALDAGLRNLADPELPLGMSEGVMASIERLDKDPFAASGPVMHVFRKTGTEGSRRNIFGWVAITGGTAISFVAMLRKLLVEESPDELIPLRIGEWSRWIEFPDISVTSLFVIVGLLLAIAGFLSMLLRMEYPNVE